MRILAQNRWPWRLHATYDETISRALDVFEKVNQDIPLDGLQLVLRSCRDDLGPVDRPHRGARRRHRRAAPHGLSGRIFRRALRRRRGRSDAAGRHDAARRASRSPPAPTRRASRPTIRGSSLAWLVTGKTVGGLADLSAAQLPRPRDGAADVDRERHLVLERGRQEGPDRGRPARRPDRAGSRLFRLRRGRDRRHRPPTSPSSAARSSTAPAISRRSTKTQPPPAMPDWSPVRTFGGYGAWGDAEMARKSELGRKLR